MTVSKIDQPDREEEDEKVDKAKVDNEQSDKKESKELDGQKNGRSKSRCFQEPASSFFFLSLDTKFQFGLVTVAS